jgi:hypothetical protein
MNINFENLEKINDILLKLNELESKISGQKRWFNINEISDYTGYSVEHIRNLKDSDFIENKHYYKTKGKLLFDKNMIDEWITSNPKKIDAKEIVSNILKDLL